MRLQRLAQTGSSQATGLRVLSRELAGLTHADRPPGRLTDLFADDARAVRTTIRRLHTWAAAHPDTVVVPTHCPEAYGRFIRRDTP